MVYNLFNQTSIAGHLAGLWVFWLSNNLLWICIIHFVVLPFIYIYIYIYIYLSISPRIDTLTWKYKGDIYGKVGRYCQIVLQKDYTIYGSIIFIYINHIYI